MSSQELWNKARDLRIGGNSFLIIADEVIVYTREILLECEQVKSNHQLSTLYRSAVQEIDHELHGALSRLINCSDHLIESRILSLLTYLRIVEAILAKEQKNE